MRLALPLGLALLGSVSLVVACVGGPGSVDQGGENGDQYGGIRADTSGNRVSNAQSSNRGDDDDDEASPTPTATTTTPRPPPPKDIKASDYEQTCAKDGDCQAVFEGSPCQVCRCPNAAIASKDATKYSTDVSTAQVACAASGTSSTGGACAPCTSQAPRCSSSRCTP